MLPKLCTVCATLHMLAEHCEATAQDPSPVSKSSPCKDEHTQEIMSSLGRNPGLKEVRQEYIFIYTPFKCPQLYCRKL